MGKKLFLGLTVFTAFISCTSDSESDLYGDIPEVVTYSETVKAIIDENCIVCHSQPPVNGAPMPLINYDFVKSAVISRGLIDRISSTDPAFLMPFGGTRLPQSQIDLIIAWRDANYPE